MKGVNPVADATIRKNHFGVYQVRFRFAGRQHERSLQTESKREAADRLGAIRMVLRHIRDGVVSFPESVDAVAFVVSGGKLRAARSPEAVVPPPAKPVTLRQAGKRYVASYPDNAKESETLATESTHLRHLYRLLGGGRHLGSLGRSELQEYVNRRATEKGRRGTVQRKTLKMELDTFRQVWNWAADEGIVTGTCPILTRQAGRRSLAVNLPKGREKERFRCWDDVQSILKKGVTPEREAELWECLFLDGRQVADLLTHVRERALYPWLYPMFAFAAFTGARVSEICRARVEDVNLGAGGVTLREKKKRQDRHTFRTVPLAPPLAEVLQRWLAQHPGGPYLFCKPAHLQKANQPCVPLTRAVAESHFKAVLRGSQWGRLAGWHLFRHSFASNLARTGSVGQAYIDEILGHQTAEMRERYRHLFPDQIRSAVAELVEMYVAG